MNKNQPSGLLLIDKPKGITSFDVIRALRRQTGVRKVGHTGTLDPMATGLMLMLFGGATKQASKFSKLDKTYLAEMTLGATSTTGDAEGEITPVESRKLKVERAEVKAALKKFEGEITQTPSIYSAIKIGGKEAYKYAHAHQEVVVPPRRVTVYSIKLLDYDYPVAKFEAKVSSGTYIRSLAEDIGQELGAGAYLSALRRVEVGDYRIDQAHTLTELDQNNLSDLLLTI